MKVIPIVIVAQLAVIIMLLTIIAGLLASHG